MIFILFFVFIHTLLAQFPVNLSADEILAVRFEQHDNTEDDEED